MNTVGWSRQQWRRQLRERRRNIDTVYAQASSQSAAAAILADTFWRSTHIGLFVAHDGELDPLPIAQAAWGAGKHVYLPVVTVSGMQFCPWSAADPLTPNRYGIGEPRGKLITADVLELLVLPTVGWTASGFRLGMGGGYYDRFLTSQACANTLRVGLAYDCQRADALDSLKQPWDQPIDGVLTESGVRRFKSRCGGDLR